MSPLFVNCLLELHGEELTVLWLFRQAGVCVCVCVGVVGWLPIGILSQYVPKRLAPNLGSEKTRTLVFIFYDTPVNIS